MEGHTTADTSASPSMGMLPKSNTTAYVFAIILLLIVLIGAVVLFAFINSQSAILPTASNTIPTSVVTTTPTETLETTASVEKPLNQQQAQSQLTQLQTLMNNYTSAEGGAYSSANSSIGQTGQESQEQTTFGNL